MDNTPEGPQTDAQTVDHLEKRYRVLFRNLKLGLIALLVVGLVSAYSLWQVTAEKQAAVTNSQIVADSAKNSDLCKVYPDTKFCQIAKDVSDNPAEPIKPEAIPGKDGRGVATFENQNGNLIVHYTDGITQNVGQFVGKDGAQGPQGPTGKPGTNGTNGTNGAAGRGITSTNIVSGSLIVSFTDGTSQDLGIVIGPKGDKGDTGDKGQDGAPGKTLTSLATDAEGNVTIIYNDNTSAVVGKITFPTVDIQCDASTNQLLYKMSNQTEYQRIDIDCTPDSDPFPKSTNLP